MNQEERNKLDILFEQIDFSKELKKHFEQGELVGVQVYREAKVWKFSFRLQKSLPASTYEVLYAKMQQAFSHIANVRLQFQVTEQLMDEDELEAYWKIFIRSLTDILPSYKDLLHTQVPTIQDRNIIIYARNQGEANSLKNKLTDEFKGFSDQMGLPSLSIVVEVKEALEEIQKFREEQVRENQELIKKTVEEKEERERNRQTNEDNRPIRLGYKINDESIQIEEIQQEERRITVQGYVFDADIRELRSGRSLLLVKITDYSDSIQVKMFSNTDDHKKEFERLKQGHWIKARGSIQTDMYSNELTMMANDIEEIKVAERMDEAEEKRIELHAHTTMSQLDAVVSPGRLVAQAAKWGHEAIAITDHAGVQGFPEAHAAGKKHGIKVVYGVEINLVDDGIPIAYNPRDESLEDATYVVFDVETTGLSAVYDSIIELAGVKIRKGEIIDRFERFSNPHHSLSATTIELTGITDDMVRDAPDIDIVLKEFREWIEMDTLVAHNATFDIGFINAGYKKMEMTNVENPVVDTLELSRFLVPKLRNHRLNTLCKHFDIELTQHHRAIYDAEATAYLMWRLTRLAIEQEIFNQTELNNHMGEGDAYQRARPLHCTILTQNEIGLKNLYKLISFSHMNYFYRVPRVPRSLLEKYREGLLIGTGCNQGEVFETMLQRSEEDAERVVEFYDYIEVQPPANYAHLMKRDLVQNEAQTIDIIRKIVKLGESTNKPVLATGNSHYIEDHEKIYREILIAAQPGNPLNRSGIPDTPFRTTNEMLDAFKFLGPKIAKQIVVDNPRELVEKIEDISPLKQDLYTPNIEGADEEIREMTYNQARSLYGDDLPEIVQDRLEKELTSIIDNGFAVIYLISQKLVKRSLDDGYLVGSRGSVGSSLVATMTGITEVNPLPPHYACTACHHNEFITDGSAASGFDLPEKNCPKCSKQMLKDGQDIPFETFLGFKGDKVPDIDLNFSGEYQPKAHAYTKELFGEDYVFRAGTIGTIAQKTAYGYVKGYTTDNQLMVKGAEIDRLVHGCTGVKRTTGQHPGGIIVVPADKEIYDFTPIQYPADDRTSEWKTTHFDFHSIEENLLKLDILGHDDPTVIRMLQDLSGLDPKTLPVGEAEVMKIFSSPEVLGVTAEQIGCETGTLGVPEFGTRFVRQMLEETKPSTFAELVIISGLSHGTDVWIGNAQELINNGTCEISEVIGCRDDIMVYLMHKGLDASLAFKIMEFVRKGRGLQDDWIVEMKKHGVPNWYIESCEKIKYMFPKAHAVAYVLMAVRIAYFKVHHPIYFYAAYFSVRASDFELNTMVQGSEVTRARIKEIEYQGNDATPKEKNLLTVLEVTLEMLERGFKLQKVDLYKSSATEFIVDGDTLIPPFNAVDGLGTNAALNIVEVRKDGEFLSKEDLRQRSRISKTVIEYLDSHGCLEGMEEKNQLSLF